VGHTTGKVTSQHTVIYDELVRRHGQDGARRYADANQAGVERLATLVDELGIDCELVRTPAYVYSNDEANRDLLTREAAAAVELGLPARLVDGSEIGLPAVVGVAFDNQVQIHPGRYLAGVAAALTDLGVRIFEHSRVTEVDESGDRPRSPRPPARPSGRTMS
jgi:glycine/D-amino acid oxidase-like deaminating enzyme